MYHMWVEKFKELQALSEHYRRKNYLVDLS